MADIEENLLTTLKRNSDMPFKLWSVHIRNKDLEQFKRDGLLKGHSLGWTIIEGSAEIMNDIRFGRGNGENCGDKIIIEENLNRLLVFTY